jgi:hypothetical protein
MLLDARNFSNNSLVGLPREFINSCKAETVVTATTANDLATTEIYLLKQDLTNFLFTILFEVDSTHMEGSTKTGNNVTWTINGIVRITPFHTAAGPSNPTTCLNILAARRIVFSSVCD